MAIVLTVTDSQGYTVEEERYANMAELETELDRSASTEYKQKVISGLIANPRVSVPNGRDIDTYAKTRE
jgi:hypothetical protein